MVDPTDVLLADIVANPDDDVPRLIYADWLDDMGGPVERARAEHIRLQVMLARMSEDDENRPEREAQERRLRKRYERHWLGSLREHVHGWAFSRGFLTHLSLDAAKLLRLADSLFARHPLTSLRLTAARDRMVLQRLAQLPQLQRLTSLDLSNNYLDRGDVEPLLLSPYLGGLQQLRFNDNPYGYDAVTAVAEAPELAGLTSLEMRRNNLTEATAVQLGDSPYLVRLTLLDLRGNTISEAGREQLRSLYGQAVRF
jgi:uncharacterized protein (TIGR02996 family)